MIKKPIIAITGCIGSGKDTIGKIICELDPEYSIYKFATPLRKVFSIITGIPEENTVSESDKNFDLSSKSV
jgi:cytidylate kinase